MTTGRGALVRSLDATLPAAPPSPYARIRGIALAGNVLILVFVLGFGAWAAIAPLESAAIAPGIVEAETSRKTIQHLEGGIVREVLVRDGDVVAAGDPLLRLDDTRARTRLQALRMQVWEARARATRLAAERENADAIVIPADLLDERARAPALATFLAAEQALFASRREVTNAQVAILRERRAQIEKEIVALSAQEEAAVRRVAIVAQELDGVRSLVDKGIAPRPRLTALERELAEVEGRRGEGTALVARARQSIAEIEANLIKLQMDRFHEVAQALADTQSTLHQLLERIEEAQDELARTVVVAPNAGTVVDLRVRTLGAVVSAGAPLLDLVPRDDRLVVAARLRPEDIDVVRVGQPAEVHLVGTGRREAPLAGIVAYVAADRHANPRDPEPHFTMRIRLEDERVGAPGGVAVLPGMSVQVFVKTGETTAALYALAPFLDSIDRAFREP